MGEVEALGEVGNPEWHDLLAEEKDVTDSLTFWSFSESFRASLELLTLTEFLLSIPDNRFSGTVPGKVMASRLGWHCVSLVLCHSKEENGQGNPTEAARPEALWDRGRSERRCRSLLITGGFS